MGNIMNNGLLNEDNFIFLIKQHVKSGYSSFIFKGDNGLAYRYDDIVTALKFECRSSRKTDKFYKADVVLVDRHNNIYPVSIKMSDSVIAWESADGSLKHMIYDFVDCYGSPTIPHGVKLIIPNDGIDLKPYVFGDDIIDENGIILIQKFKQSDFKKFNNHTTVVNCSRVFKHQKDVYDDSVYNPSITIRSDRSRNLSDPKAKGYRIEVSPIGQSKNIWDIVDSILFK